MRASGSTVPDPIVSSGTSMLVTFSSDFSNVAPGVVALVTFAPLLQMNSPLCSQPANITTSGTAISTNPGFSNYNNSQRCVWLVTAPPSPLITIRFGTFNTESSDYFSVYLGGSSSAYQYLYTSGTWLPYNIGVYNQMFLTFVSNSVGTGPGVNAKIIIGPESYTYTNAPCSIYTAINVNGTAISTNDLFLNYSNYQQCTWTVVATPAQTPMIVFDSFDTELGFDFLTVYDGAS